MLIQPTGCPCPLAQPPKMMYNLGMKIRGQTVYPLTERLQRLSRPNKKTGCVEWVGSTRNGYGRLVTGSRTNGTRKSVSAHRAAYEAHIGPIPKGLYVLHRCDNPKCINPEHLFIGTRQDNVDDREKKGRNNPKPLGKHENHPNAILTWRGVKWARSATGKTPREIADALDVSPRTISDVLRFKTWIPAPPISKGDK